MEIEIKKGYHIQANKVNDELLVPTTIEINEDKNITTGRQEFPPSKKFKLEGYMRFGPGEVKQGNHLNPRIQGSCIEALIGAIYLDSNFESSKKWVLQQYTEVDFDIEVDASFESDYKSRLQEYTQQRKLGTPQYQLILMSGPSHKPNFLVALFLNDIEKVRAEGASKKIAEQKAAEMLLKELLKETL